MPIHRRAAEDRHRSAVRAVHIYSRRHKPLRVRHAERASRCVRRCIARAHCRRIVRRDLRLMLRQRRKRPRQVERHGHLLPEVIGTVHRIRNDLLPRRNRHSARTAERQRHIVRRIDRRGHARRCPGSTRRHRQARRSNHQRRRPEQIRKMHPLLGARHRWQEETAKALLRAAWVLRAGQRILRRGAPRHSPDWRDRWRWRRGRRHRSRRGRPTRAAQHQRQQAQHQTRSKEAKRLQAHV